MKKIFTFLVAFLTTVSGAVWGQTYPVAGSGSGTQEDPYILDLNDPKDIGDVNGLNVGSIVDWHGDSGLTGISDLRYDAFQIQSSGYYRVINSAGSDAISTYRIDIDNGDDWNAGEVRPVELNVTLILDNVNIEVTNPKDRKAPIWIEDNGSTGGEASEHKVTIQLVGKNSLTFKQDEMDGAAIATNGNCDLTITGNGYLRAEGQVGIGMVEGISGDITINGGTVVAVGHNGPGFGGSRDNGTNLIINGNTLVISAGSQDIGEMQENLVKGIYYDSTSEYNSAMVHGDVTLDSQFPSSEELQNILGSDLTIDFAADGRLTLGEGVYFRADKLVNPTTNEAKLKAYKVTYDLNNNIKLGDTDYTITVDGAAPTSVYAGPNVVLSELPTATNTVQTWQAMAWGKESNEAYQEVTTTPATPSPITTAANSNSFEVETIWAVEKWTTIQVTEYGIMDKGIQLFYPQEAASLYTLTGGEALTQYGAKIGTDNGEKNQVVPEGSVTATASETINNVTLTISGEGKTITLPFLVLKDVPNLKDATFAAKDVVYDGKVIEGTDVVSISHAEVPTIGVQMYTLKYALDDNNNVGSELQSAPANVGIYWVKAVANEDVTNLEGETEYDKFKITPAKANVTANEKSIENPTAETSLTFVTNDLTVKPLEDDVLSISSATVALVNANDPWQTVAGTYKIKYTDIALDGTDKDNYNAPTEVTGNLKVTIKGTDVDPIDPGDGDEENPIITPEEPEDGENGWKWDTDGYTRVYDGVAFPFTPVISIWDAENGSVKKQTLTDGQYSITYTPDGGSASENVPKNQGTYTANITITDESLPVSGTVKPIKLVITPRPMDVTINQITADDLDKTVTELGATYETFNSEKNRGIVEAETKYAGITGSMTITPKDGSSKEYTVTFSGLALASSGGDDPYFLAANYTPTFKYGTTILTDGEGSVDITIDDITPGGDIDDGDNDDNNWEWDATLEGGAYGIVYDGKGHGVATVTVDGQPRQPDRITYSNEEGTLAEGVLPTDAGNYTAKVVITVNKESKTGTFPLLIKQRPLGVHFNLDDYLLDAGEVYDAQALAEYEPVDGIGGVLADEKPVLEGTIKVADTPNSEGKYAVTFDGVKLGTEGNFDANNYDPTYYLNGELIKLDGNGDGTFGDDDPEQGIDISEPDDETGISGIGTKRYRLYLANKDYNVVDAKADYAAEGLELFSRHDRKYTKVGGSFTVWYEKDGVANAGGYRIFWSNRANGEYKEVKFDTVSEYFQIRNVQSDVYVKIYAADGFPVGNEEISAADYRAYAQPNKIVVITPQPTDVQIISMAGAVVATDKVTGQREFANLTEGVYIVRMGETVVKLQVRK